MTPDILFEDNHLLVVAKPAGMAVMGGTGVDPDSTLHAWAAAYLKRKYAKPGNVFVGIVHRLDRVTSGVIVLARTSKAAGRLSGQFARKNSDGPTKVYQAIVAGGVQPAAGRWEDRLLKDDAAARMRVVRSGGQEALAEYRVVGSVGGNDVLEVTLLTGRKHQIRVQAASRGHAILGDRKYGGPVWTTLSPNTKKGVPGSIALHAFSLSLDHPTQDRRMTFQSSPGWVINVCR